MNNLDLSGKQILILGFAREGRSVCEFIRRHYPLATIEIWDQAPKEKISPENLTYLEENGKISASFLVGNWKSVTNWDEFDVIIKSAGIPLKNLPEKIHPKITSETEIFFSVCPGPIIGVTGTKGKSTTASLISAMLLANNKRTVLLGNIGKPALDYLDQIDQETICVFELSSHQLQTLAVSPHVAVLLNIYSEHLDFYADFADYAQAKANITLHQTPLDYFVYREDNPEVKTIAERTKARKLPFSKGNLIMGRKLIKGTKLSGDAYALDAVAAFKAAAIYGVTEQIAKQAIHQFKPLEHRLEYVGRYKGIDFYNDSLATIPEATEAALAALGSRVQTIFLGGFDRGIDYANFADHLAKTKIKNFILFPVTGEKIWRELQSHHPEFARKVRHKLVDTMSAAIEEAYRSTSPGKIALLSCASSSFNLFKNYQDRGEQFKKEVRRLANEK